MVGLRASENADEVKPAARCFTGRFDNPTLPSKNTARIGGRRQSRWLRTADGFAV
jgi:hypothetical protein